MSTQYKHKPRQRSMSTHPTGANPQYSLEPRQQLTKDGQQLFLSRQHADDSQAYTKTTNKQSKRTSSVNGNEPQLLAEIFKPTVEAMQALNMLALAKTANGKLVIILPTSIFNDDLTLKGVLAE